MYRAMTVLVVLAFVVPPSWYVAQPTNPEQWNTLLKLSSGTRVRLVLNDGAEVTGRLVSATTDAVVLERNEIRKGRLTIAAGTSLRDPVTFPRSEVSSVEQIKGLSRGAKAALWIGVGWLAAGVIVGSIMRGGAN